MRRPTPGVVWSDHYLDQVDVNPEAARLLGVGPGELLAIDFILAMKRLVARALNQEDLPSTFDSLFDEVSADLDATLRFSDAPTHLQVRSVAFSRPGFPGRLWTFDYPSPSDPAGPAMEAANDLLRANADSMLDSQVLIEAVRGPGGRVVDFVYRAANHAACSLMRVEESELIGSRVSATGGVDTSGLIARWAQCLQDGKPVQLDDFEFGRGVLRASRRFDIRAVPVRVDGLSVTWSEVTDRFLAAQQIEASERRYRQSIDNAAIGICSVAPDGHFTEVNNALCRFFGYDAETLYQKRWQEMIPAKNSEEALQNVEDILEGRIDAFRITQQYLHADGNPIWGDLSVSGIRDEAGQVTGYLTQIADVTTAVDAKSRNHVLAQQLQQQSQRLTAELDSAASYMKSIMPTGLTGSVNVSARYLPSQTLGGDCFNYFWLDDDHFVFTLIDVSGHGIRPALLAVSVHNMLNSGTFSVKCMLRPETVLTELNRLFPMERHDGHYFVMWYGVYQHSTRTLRYTSAGTPPPLAFASVDGRVVSVTELSEPSLPVGTFDTTIYTSETFRVPHGCQILAFSDGATELELANGRYTKFADIKNLATRLVGSPDFSLDHLIDQLCQLASAGTFKDDCSIIHLTFS